MIERGRMLWGVAWLAAVVGATWAGVGEPSRATALQVATARGSKVTFEPMRRGDGLMAISQPARLLSLAVERGETPTPFLPPGAFRATFRTTVTLPARDRMRFRIDGRGKVTLRINGKDVLEGAMRRNKTLETAKAVRLKKGGNDLELIYESAARGDGQLRVFWSGFDFGFEPIAPELMRYAVDDEVEEGNRLRIGHRLFIERRCARCHWYDGKGLGESANGELDLSGPDLRRVGARAHPGWLAAWLRDPRQFRPDATMPRFALSDHDAADIATYLAGLAEPLPAPPFRKQQVEEGQQLFLARGCVACHPRHGAPHGDAAFGNRISLQFVGRKWQPAALVAYLLKPTQHYPDVRMPNLELSAEDGRALAAYLLQGGQPMPAEAGDAKKGRRLVQKHGCNLCHALDDIPPGDRVFPLMDNLKPERGCLADQPGKSTAPEHGLNDDERAALRAYLPFAGDAPFRNAPLDFVARHVVGDRCIACHALDGEPSTWARVAERLSLREPLPPEQDPVAQGVPALTWIGAKLQPSWIRRFVIGELGSPRPWLTARMPNFERHGAAVSTGLVREHGYGSQDEPVRPPDARVATFGQRLVAQGTGFGCVQCHAIGDQKAVQVFEREGIELTTARGRLRHEYYTRWLADPTRLDPDSRMPKYANAKGKTAFGDVLDGRASDQFEAIWQYLGGLRK